MSSDFLFTRSFKKNYCVSVGIGVLTIGETYLTRGNVKYSDCFDIHTSHLKDFIKLTEQLGRNITLVDEPLNTVCETGRKRAKTVPDLSATGPSAGASCDSERPKETANVNESSEATLQLSFREKVWVHDHSISYEGTTSFSIIFDDFSYLEFVNVLKSLCLFVVNPSPRQFEAMQKCITKSIEDGMQELNFVRNVKRALPIFSFAASYANETPEEKFLLVQYLKMNASVLQSYALLSRLAG